jgi:hypothetical protein
VPEPYEVRFVDVVVAYLQSPVCAAQINLMDELTLKGVTQYYAFVEVRRRANSYVSLDVLISGLRHAGAAKDSLFTYPVFEAGNQSVHHLLQLCEPRGTFG